MNCPHCGRKMPFDDVCPYCGRKINYGGNTTIFKAAARDRLSIREILSETFVRHKHGDAMRTLMRTGSKSGVDLLANWHKPWLFIRLLAFSLLFEALIYLAATRNIMFIYMYVVMGAIIVPMTSTLFIWEMDIHGTVTFLDMLLLLLLGGILAVILALQFNSIIANAAPITEEPTKLLICVVFIALSRRKLYALDGLAIGAAVAAGFSFMETITYVFNYSNLNVLMQRSINAALSGHILYTAPFVGALCHAMNGKALNAKCFSDKLFLAMLALGIGAHAFNNSGALYIPILTFNSISISLSLIIRAVVGWSALFYIMKLGIKQALAVSLKLPAQANAVYRLLGRRGEYTNRELTVGKMPVTFGRDPNKCSVVFKAGTVSRINCTLYLSQNGLIVRDENSTHGTFINGSRLAPGRKYELNPGDILEFGKGAEKFELRS